MASGLRTCVLERQLSMLLRVTGADSRVTASRSIVPTFDPITRRTVPADPAKRKYQYRIDWPFGYGYEYGHCLLTTIINHGMGSPSRRYWNENKTCARSLDFT